MVGSHHAILLGHTEPSRKGLDLSSVKWRESAQDTMTILLMALLITTLLIMMILNTLNLGDIIYNAIAYI
jgi:hypothetical protein